MPAFCGRSAAAGASFLRFGCAAEVARACATAPPTADVHVCLCSLWAVLTIHWMTLHLLSRGVQAAKGGKGEGGKAGGKKGGAKAGGGKKGGAKKGGE